MCNFEFMCPVKDATITSKYGMRTHPITHKRQLHAGIDLVCRNNRNPPIMASADGKVRLVKSGTTGYGKYLIITHKVKGKTYETVYAHLERITVKVGQVVKMGETVGIMGTTGGSTGIHLHFEIHEGTYLYAGGTYPTSVDPMKYISLKNDSPCIKKEEEDEELKFTSPALKSETEKSLTSSEKRKIIVDFAVKNGANKDWVKKLESKTITDGDIFGLAVKAIVDINK